MNSNQTHATSPSSPRRPLRTDFTKQAIRHAVIAKRREDTAQQYKYFFKEPLSMKSLTFLRTAPGAALALAILATTGASAYALTNWFHANVTVQQHDSVLSVDLSQCEGNLPPGVEPTTTNQHNVQFKIIGNPHISADDLQQDLLGQCEASSVTEFYAKLFPESGLSSTGHPTSLTTQSHKYILLAGVVTATHADTITVRSTGAKGASFATRSFNLASNSTVYNAGDRASLGDVKAGDPIIFLAYAANAPEDPIVERTSILDDASVQIVSIFKTQYNDGAASSFNYQSNNIMPLDTYNQTW